VLDTLVTWSLDMHRSEIHLYTNTFRFCDSIKSIILTGGNIKIPKIQQYIRQFFGPSIQFFSSIDPCDVNARGAATQASLIATRNPILKPKRMVPSCPLSIGVASSDGSFIPVIPIDTIVPVKIIKSFGLVNGQKKVLVSVYEGEDNIAVNNNLLGQFVFTCESPDSDTFQIGFIMDQNGVLKLVSKGGSYKIDGLKNRQSKEEVAKIRATIKNK